MKRHDETLLWQYAARELDAEEAALIEHHLGECVDCRERLLDVRQARLVLQDAQAPRPRVEWAKVDQSISQLVEARLLRQAKASRMGWRLPLAFAAMAAVVAVVASTAKLDFSALVRPAEVAVAPAPVPAPLAVTEGTEVEQALGLSRVGAELSLAREGERVAAGEVLRTAVGGRGMLALPDGSRMRLAGGSQLALTRTESDDVALTLERGRVGVQASHRARRGFVIHTNGLSVRVVGTLFTVSQVAGVVEVAVAEGKVLVEPPEGESLSLVGGQRVRFERGTWKPLRGSATPAQIAELNEFTAPPMIEARGAPRTPAAGLMPPGAMARRDDSAARNGAVQQSSQVVGVALTPEPVPAQKEGLLPRKPSVARGAATVWPSHVGAPAVTPPAQEEAPQLEEKASVWPSMGGGPKTYEPRVYKPSKSAAKPAPETNGAVQQPVVAPAAPIAAYQLEVEAPGSAPRPASDPADFSGWPNGQPVSTPDPKVWPEPQAPDPEVVPPPAKVVVVPVPAAEPKPETKGKPPKIKNGEPLPGDLEALFLQRAERGMDRGICERYLLGLQEILSEGNRNDRAEKARILRARCYDSRVRPDLSEIEYRRYLEVWPKGRYSDEARKAVIE
jgi:hypothetical protein